MELLNIHIFVRQMVKLTVQRYCRSTRTERSVSDQVCKKNVINPKPIIQNAR
jgi:hypothetical protein